MRTLSAIAVAALLGGSCAHLNPERHPTVFELVVDQVRNGDPSDPFDSSLSRAVELMQSSSPEADAEKAFQSGGPQFLGNCSLVGCDIAGLEEPDQFASRKFPRFDFPGISDVEAGEGYDEAAVEYSRRFNRRMVTKIRAAKK